MANQEQLALLKQGVETWNEWRKNNPTQHVDLSGATLRGMQFARIKLSDANLTRTNLSEANLHGANLRRANLNEANLRSANLGKSNLRGASLRGADLRLANLYKVDLYGANLRGVNAKNADLQRAKLSNADLQEANITEANLSWADLTGSKLMGSSFNRTSFYKANLTGANLSSAILHQAQLVGTDVSNADLTASSIYGVSAWDLKMNTNTKQENLIITPPDEPAILVDNIKVAQFIYLLLNNEEIRDVIDTITSKAVLILGRFSDDRKPILNALRDALRDKGFLPIVFDFERPKGRDFTETIMILAGMSCFVIADITNPKSAPLELQATVPDYMIPFVPILQDGEPGFSMFSSLQTKYDWVLNTLGYDSSQSLIDVLDDAVINPALVKRHELELIKARDTPTRHVDDYRKRL